MGKRFLHNRAAVVTVAFVLLIALIGILPLLGGALYLAFGNKRPAKRLRLKMQAVEDVHKKTLYRSRVCWKVWMPASRGRADMWQSTAPIRRGRTLARSILPAAKPCIRSCWPIWKRLKEHLSGIFHREPRLHVERLLKRSCVARLRRAWMCA